MEYTALEAVLPGCIAIEPGPDSHETFSLPAAMQKQLPVPEGKSKLHLRLDISFSVFLTGMYTDKAQQLFHDQRIWSVSAFKFKTEITGLEVYHGNNVVTRV